MSPVLRNTLAVIAGLIFGSVVNMLTIMLSSIVIPPPAGADPSSMESLKATMHLFEPRHFIFPFLAHALGTFAGAWVAATISITHRMGVALGIGMFFLAGGIANTFLLPAPTWFIVVDLVLAYIPMGYLGGKMAYVPVTKANI